MFNLKIWSFIKLFINLKKENCFNNKKDKEFLSIIYEKKKNKQECNCLCCKFCNDYWKPYKPKSKQENIEPKKIKFKKEFYCNKGCGNCIKYMHKKEI